MRLLLWALDRLGSYLERRGEQRTLASTVARLQVERDAAAAERDRLAVELEATRLAEAERKLRRPS